MSIAILQMHQMEYHLVLCSVSASLSVPCLLCNLINLTSGIWQLLTPRKSCLALVGTRLKLHYKADRKLSLAGYHPWFSHLISTTSDPISKDEHYRSLFLPASVGNVINSEETNISPPPPDSLESQFLTLLAHLPNPRPLSEVLIELRQNLSDFSESMLGEVGVDRVFRIPLDYFASPRHLTTFTIPLAHQVTILEAQIEIAVELGRNISMHSVKCQQATLEVLGKMKRKFGEKWNRISLDMHSCGFSPQTWRDIEVRWEGHD